MPDVISTALPAVTPADSTIYEVSTGDASAKITTFTIHLSQDTPEALLEAAGVQPLLSYVPTPNP